MKTKNSINTIKKNGIHFLINENKKKIKSKPWLGDIFSFLYDRIMRKSVFPKKFNASIEKHYKILKKEFENINDKIIIEFATGTGDAVNFLKNNNTYSGVDISPGLLRRAKKKFDNYSFPNFELYVADACNTPFQDHTFDIGICNLSLNFFQNIDDFISEVKRVLKKNGTFYCSIPIPERKTPQAKINGKLYSTDELKKKFEKENFNFIPLPAQNGALLYFKNVPNSDSK